MVVFSASNSKSKGFSMVSRVKVYAFGQHPSGEAAGAVGYSEANVGGDPAERAAERVLFGGPPTKRAL